MNAIFVAKYKAYGSPVSTTWQLKPTDLYRTRDTSYAIQYNNEKILIVANENDEKIVRGATITIPNGGLFANKQVTYMYDLQLGIAGGTFTIYSDNTAVFTRYGSGILVLGCLVGTIKNLN